MHRYAYIMFAKVQFSVFPIKSKEMYIIVATMEFLLLYYIMGKCLHMKHGLKFNRNKALRGNLWRKNKGKLQYTYFFYWITDNVLLEKIKNCNSMWLTIVLKFDYFY